MKKFINLTTLLSAIILLALPNLTSAQNVVNDSYGKGISFLAQDSSFYTKLGFRFQTLYMGQHNLTSGDWSERMMIRRSRLKFDGWAFSPKVVYKIEF